MKPSGNDADVIVIGGGIAGLGAAVRLKDRGLEPLVLEAESRIGGRMTTDRVNGFVIDRGVTLFANGFRSMRALVKRLGLSSLKCKGKFSVGIQDAAGVRGYRGGRFDDLRGWQACALDWTCSEISARWLTGTASIAARWMVRIARNIFAGLVAKSCLSEFSGTA